MSQTTPRHDAHAKRGDEDEEVAYPQARQPEHHQRKQDARSSHPVGQPAGDDPVSPDEPEFRLTGDDDLSPADLGPLAPNTTDPDADSLQPKKITR
jgi:hypothetical protein